MTFITWDDPVEFRSGGLKKREAPPGTGAAVAAGGGDRAEAAAAAGVLQMPVFYMKKVLLWPEGQTALGRFLAHYLYPTFNWQFMVGGLAFIILEEHENFMQPLTTAGDCMAAGVLVAKLSVLAKSGPRVGYMNIHLFVGVGRTDKSQLDTRGFNWNFLAILNAGAPWRRGQLVEMRRQLQHGFTPLEARAEPEASRLNERCVARCRFISLCFGWFYLPLCLSAGSLLVYGAFSPVGERRFTTSYPRALLDSPYTYWPLFALNAGTLYTFLFFSAGYDTLFLSLCLHLSCKCEILQVLLRRAGAGASQVVDQPEPDPQPEEGRQSKKRYEFEHWNDDGSDFDAGSRVGSRQDSDEQLRACVRYHHMVISMRDETEHIFTGACLVQMMYVLIALCIPALRLLHEV
ncbi:Odorant receptor Or1 [Frankliniella fusca]|uniref:Odorant receptor n=1 Tax=Frankliniella fusca TaxID=407009 RepID=A0AAE1HBB8_9NEOP|nr:Odorant receptor Or1 [Frankliniella fusca]